jgi:hypothetical protein
MHVGFAFLLLLLTAAWARPAPHPSDSVPRIAAMQSGTPQSGTNPATPATPQAKPTAPPAAGQTTPATVKPGQNADPVVKPPDAKAPLDLKTLEEQLKDTKAIGFFSKITLKNQVDDLLDDFSDYYDGGKKHTMTGLRRSYDLLLMKVLSMVQDEDPKLATAIVSSREAIWAMLADPKTFATLKG